MSATIECREVYVPRNRLTGEGGYTTFVRRSRTGRESLPSSASPTTSGAPQTTPPQLPDTSE